MGKLGNALILSPFATYPLDAGQRKRAFQTTSLFKEWGFSITFLHFGFETRWYWGHNSEDDAVLREQWDGDVINFYANKKVGLPPVNDESHQLDEWWDEALGGYISNIFSKRKFDLFVVHNIWLSKAFDYVPHHCLKALDMHDLFSQRAKEFEATGVLPEFFHCSEKDEVFGLKRADIVVAIKQEDADWCNGRDLGNITTITIPYVEDLSSIQTENDPDINQKPVHPGKIVFGMIGSDIHFNRYAVHTLIKELEAVIRKTYAPIEFILAGSICKSVGDCPVFVKKLGFVNHVSEFYSAVDVVMVPMMHGTGVKIKAVEALNHRKPVMFTAHSAEGTGFIGQTCKSLTEMAYWASDIALSGLIPDQLSKSSLQSRAIASSWLNQSKKLFTMNFKFKSPSFIHILGSAASDNANQILLEALIGLSLHKEISAIYRSQGLCIHPKVNEYFLSIPSHYVLRLQTMQATLEAWSNSTFAIISYSQKDMLKAINPEKGPVLIIFDCRCEQSAKPEKLFSLDDTLSCRYVYILTPFQATMVPIELTYRIIVIPLIISRCKWDPHVSQLLLEIINNHSYRSAQQIAEVSADLVSNNFVNEDQSNPSQIKYNIRMVELEALKMLSACIAEAQQEFGY